MSITMTVTGVSSMFFHEYSCREIFSFASAAGLTGLEFWIETPDFWLNGFPVETVLACRQEFPEIAEMTVHAPVLDLNTCSINPEVVSVSIGYVVRSIRLAERMGAGVLTVHPGRRTAKRPPAAADSRRFEHYVAALREAAQKSRLRIGMENMEPVVNSLLCTPKRMRELLDEEPWLSFTLDISHALAGRPDDLPEYIRLCGDRLVNVHLSRAEARRLHLPLDDSPAMARIIRSIAATGYDGPLMLEIDDLNFSGALSADEKIRILGRDRAFIAKTLSKSR